jgi:hypothetical protein
MYSIEYVFIALKPVITVFFVTCDNFFPYKFDYPFPFLTVSVDYDFEIARVNHVLLYSYLKWSPV